MLLLIQKYIKIRFAKKPKTYRQAPTHWLKFYEEAVIESEARTAVVQLESEA